MSAADLRTTALPSSTAPRPVRPRRLSTRLLRSELRLIGGRRRNQAGLLVLAAVPVVMAISVKLSTDSQQGGPTFLSSITSNGLFVPLAALSVEITAFLPLAMSMLAGDAIAGEANIGTLRYLLTVPVHRTRLLAVKYLSLCIGAFWGVCAVAIPGALVGLVLFGGGPLTTLSGSQVGFASGLWRVLLVMLYLSAALSALAAVGLFISTLTEQPIAAAIALMIFTIVSFILDQVPQLAWLHPWLVVDHFTAFGDLMRDPMAFDAVGRGLGLFAVYAVVFWLAAWARFSGKDITS
ncbi:ABC transporter permease subunit [Pedococcus sp. KACC 23699]|uniref:ABC transporter permease subunit n=1 Tax=Pedococcus sp. KACC 23699 TaxID=3149228 RepID=A0AAU7JW92_9MICO